MEMMNHIIKDSYLQAMSHLEKMQKNPKLSSLYFRKFCVARDTIEDTPSIHSYTKLKELDQLAGPIFKKLKSKKNLK